MKVKRVLGLICLACIVWVIGVAAHPAAAADRVNGDFWTYDASTMVPVLFTNVAVNGTTTYTCVDKSAIDIGGTSYPVNVMKVSGGKSGAADFMGIQVSVTLGGYVYETQEGMGTAKSDISTWMNTTIGTSSFQLVYRNETEVSTTYTPAMLSGFSPSTVGAGDSWAETVASTTTTTKWVNGTKQGSPDVRTEILALSFVAASSMETVTTPAGKFEALRITATASDGSSVVYWWSSDVQNFVKEDTYEAGSATPVATMALKDYEIGSATNLALVAAMGGIALAVALVVLAWVLLKKRELMHGGM
ncbi:MAG: hypothetical protein KJ672_00160 [Candidatus Thermoplasmatota archaeon]|nr:hypothetical protein [Candidatus Thermoplasmatota archaeon]